MQFVRRKWGFYITLIARTYFKVKLLRFKKYGKMSKQYHRHRNEMWLFLSGNDAGKWVIHSIGNLHTYETIKPAWVLEIQYGNKCEEEDIVRV